MYIAVSFVAKILRKSQNCSSILSINNDVKFCRFVTVICTSLERPMPVNGESKQWHERPAIVKSNLKSILVFVKHSPGQVS